ncbi:hypothetical protein CAEBREN_29129 [Caenorhabditis brenneri]|uniref:Uncharacterized protein n=1 Tax=Caenorhabditis brenneri TaxID=135651 RepID=G0N4E1_CAEBE|nr:hypothetical protein CAEBREN_29129 [Caenorhabditis brenneri]
MPPNLIPRGLAPVNSKSRKRSDVKSSSDKISQDSSDQSRIVNLSEPGTSNSAHTQETGDFNPEWDEYQLEEEECLYNMEGVPDFHIREPTPDIESMVAPKRKIFAEEKSSTCESRNVANEEIRTTQNVSVHSDTEDKDSMPEQQLEEIEELQPFPLYDGEQASDDQEDEKKLGDEQVMLPDYEHIVENQYTKELMSEERTESAHCECHENGKDCSSEATCTNMGMMTECPSTCKAEGCRNQRIQRREYAELAIKFISEEVGHGVITLKPIRRGQFVIEYVGEVTQIGDEEKATSDSRHRYFFDSESHRIDATRKGNISRFINHHCSPNLECHKWSVPGTPDNLQRLVFFAKNDIEAGEEINFDYQFNNDDAETRQECHCDSDNCKKIIGRVPAELLPEDIVTIGETLSDKELEEELAKLQQMSNPERKRELIKQLLSEFTIRNEAHIPSIIKIAHEMEDANQRRRLLKEIFSLETRGQTQELYAPQVAELMKKWVRVQDSSSRNVKLVHEILTIFFQNKKKMFNFGKDDRSVLIGWLESAAPNETSNKTDKLLEVRKMAKTLDVKWYLRSIRIPRKSKPTSAGSAPAVGVQCRKGQNIPAKSPEVLGSRRQHRSRSHSSRRSRSQSPPTPRSPSPFSDEAKKLESMIRSVQEQNYSCHRRGNGPYEEREIRRVYRNWSSSRRCSPIRRRSRSRSPIVRRREFDECRNGSRPESPVSHGTDPRRKRSYAERVSNSQHHYLSTYQNGKSHNYRRFPSSNRPRSPSPPTPRSPSPFSPEAKLLEFMHRSVREQNYSRQRRGYGPYEEREIRRVYRNWPSYRRCSPIRRRSRSRSPTVRRREFNECRNESRPAFQGMKVVERSKDGVSRKSTSNDLK